MPDNYIYSNTDENRFWLQIFGDNARLILDALSPEQTTEAQQAREFIKQFDELLARSHDTLTPEQLIQLNKEAYSATKNFRQYLLDILKKQMTAYTPVSIQPAIINNAVTFTEEYMYLLDAFINNKQPVFNPFENDTSWLEFFILLSIVISTSSGMYQGQIREKAAAFTKRFEDLYGTASQLHGIYRIGTTSFPIADQQRKNTIRALQDFAKFLAELISLVQQNRVPGTMSLLYLDRSYRILCYYLTQLSAVSRMEKPSCDPLRPRISESQYNRM